MRSGKSFVSAGLIALTGLGSRPAQAVRAEIPSVVRDPYVGAIVVDGASGDVLWEDRADALAYPASIVKLMDLLLVLELVDRGALRLDQPVRVSARAARMGGSQVYLKEGETFSVEDLLYALIVQSANDAAVALAEHAAGTVEAFVARMNERAAALGMSGTRFHSVHGLPPGEGQQPDVTTPRDVARLCVELLKHPEALRFTSAARRVFREKPTPFVMETHNRLLGSFEGCDGLKTGYFRLAGYSIAATAAREGRRVVAVVMGSPVRATRDQKARELLTLGLQQLAARAPPPVSVLEPPAPKPPEAPVAHPKRGRKLWAALMLAIALIGGVHVARRIFRLYGRRGTGHS